MYSVYTGSNNRGKPVINHNHYEIKLAANSKIRAYMSAVVLVALAFYFLVLELQTQVSRFQWLLLLQHLEVEANAINFASNCSSKDKAR